MERSRSIALSLLLFVAACSSQPTLGDYADDIDPLVTTMNAKLDASLDTYRGGARTAGRLTTHLADRVAARDEFLEAFADLAVPDVARELSEGATAIIGDLRGAEATLLAKAANLDPAADDSPVWQSAEAAALEAADARAIELCRSAREAFNAADREEFTGLYWVPPELQDVVDVAFRCTLEERGRS